MNTTHLLSKIDQALTGIELNSSGASANIESIHRQLTWCRAQLTGQPSGHKQGPLTMGLIATREFDMWGDNPELASLINEIQRAFG
ncbi:MULTISPECIES: hypothetical protein [Paraburkholderia]|uniref:hypothetical protein n=1 Tax=Paraburkholderia TaxID=1822464 RepID=UPI00078E3209|nr:MULTISPECIES: hypothetical protein [Paraburkholderia]AMV43407.1 hypothetical protein ATN79_12050 [Paraburkholderia caribensis]CAG9237498.1 conserved hypothetical protein [Paraburkholderia caribensis]